jgi:tetratricopeptide (TPR) repeat protein
MKKSSPHSVARLALALALSALAVAAVASGASATAATADARFPLFEGLGPHVRRVTTRSPDAQRYFTQGLNFLYGFNHGAAIRSFKESARLDPGCAMAHWGIALANGPHINFPMVPPPNAAEAWAELQLAQKNAASASAVERALITALAVRYANPQPEDRGPLDRAYADAMRQAWREHPDDADVGALFAEAMMDLRPWDQWTPKGEPQPGTEEIIATLEAVLKLELNHPFANHLYVHAVEASPQPERALPAANRLRELQPALAHNVHMPSHIDIRIGHWQEAITANEKAVEADKKFRAIVGPPKDLIIVYAAHNRHMLAYAAMMTGRRELALAQIRAMVDALPEDFLKEYAMLAEGLVAMPYEVMVRFGQWDEILAAPDHPEWMPLTRALRHAARGIAFAAKDDPKNARLEEAAFLEAAKKVPAEESFGNDPATAILAIARPMLAGEILVREGKLDAGVAQLREAVAAEDALHYDEPPGWILPVRHSLGATLMGAGRFADAEQVYRDDLERLPENGWSLFGLSRALKLQHKTDEGDSVEARFEQIWQKADLQLTSSCLCQPGT